MATSSIVRKREISELRTNPPELSPVLEKMEDCGCEEIEMGRRKIRLLSREITEESSCNVLSIPSEVFVRPVSPTSTVFMVKAERLVKCESLRTRVNESIRVARRILLDYVPHHSQRVGEVKEENSGLNYVILKDSSGKGYVAPQIGIAAGARRTMYLGVGDEEMIAALHAPVQRKRYLLTEPKIPIPRGRELIKSPVSNILPSRILTSAATFWGEGVELCERGTWDQYFKGLSLVEKQSALKEMMPMVAQTLCDLHRQGLVFGDLKGGNLLVKASQALDVCSIDNALKPTSDRAPSKFEVCITDLESIFVAGTGSPPTHLRTLFFLPPQYRGEKVIDWDIEEADYDPRGDDVWAFGVVLFKTLCGKYPVFLREIDREIQILRALNLIWENKEKFITDTKNEMMDNGVDSFFINLVLAMLEPIGNKRASIEICLS